ncbi:cell division protein [Bifidobacterium xylocopae]|uniref:cell division protein n=1 Tax=Bifidobacterium xylocopae TaxID=2493119 RepID=UPI0038B3B106
MRTAAKGRAHSDRRTPTSTGASLPAAKQADRAQASEGTSTRTGIRAAAQDRASDAPGASSTVPASARLEASPAHDRQPKPASPERDLPALPDMREEKNSEPATPASREEFTTVYDIIDQMESLLDEAKSSVFSPSVAKVDREEFMSSLADLKKMLPVQLERASALMREAERRLDTAQTQANAIISQAQSQAADVVREAGEQAEFLAGQENVVAIAQRKAQTIIDQAQAHSDKLVQGANEYSAKVMEALSGQLDHYRQDVQAGLGVLREREREAASKLNQSYAEDDS